MPAVAHTGHAVDRRQQLQLLRIADQIGDFGGVARYDVFFPVDDEAAEAAFVIEDQYQGKGLGTALMVRLAKYAQKEGVQEFVFTVHGSNQAMLKLLRKCGDVVERHHSGGVFDVRVRLKAFEEG
jgi:RimJ/RimL family protein N-acetyltransferase